MSVKIIDIAVYGRHDMDIPGMRKKIMIKARTLVPV